jgi:hypothetical protein
LALSWNKHFDWCGEKKSCAVHAQNAVSEQDDISMPPAALKPALLHVFGLCLCVIDYWNYYPHPISSSNPASRPSSGVPTLLAGANITVLEVWSNIITEAWQSEGYQIRFKAA